MAPIGARASIEELSRVRRYVVQRNNKKPHRQTTKVIIRLSGDAVRRAAKGGFKADKPYVKSADGILLSLKAQPNSRSFLQMRRTDDSLLRLKIEHA